MKKATRKIYEILRSTPLIYNFIFKPFVVLSTEKLWTKLCFWYGSGIDLNDGIFLGAVFT